MRKLFVFFSKALIVSMLFVGFSACEGEDDPIPTVAFSVDINTEDGYQVDITVQTTDVESLSWDYGDGSTSTQSGDHSYTYTASGDYTISVTAIGPGGTATDQQSITINTSIIELIAGTGSEGKTWVLTQLQATNFAEQGGASPVVSDLVIPEYLSGNADNVLGIFGLGDEYADEFTFYRDGKFTIEIKNNLALASRMFGKKTGLTVTESSDYALLPLCAVTYQNIDNGSWALNYDALTVHCYNEFTSGTEEDVVFKFGSGVGEHVASFELSDGAYLGYLDLQYPAMPDQGLGYAVNNSVHIIKEITADAMHLAVAIGDNKSHFFMPSFMMHLTLVPKQ